MSNKIAKVLVDQRERNQQILQALEAGSEVEVRTLPIGDYIVSDRVAIERKTIQDFQSSIISGRIFDQVSRILEHYSRPIIIIEGDKSEFLLGNNVFLGAIISLYVDYNSAVVFSSGPEETAEIIIGIAKHEQNKEKRALSLKGAAHAYRLRDFQLFVIGNLPGVGPKLSEALLSHFKSVKNIVNASIEELMDVDKIGRKKAEQIHKVFTEQF
jgi:ERCC4-type nuclease